MQLDFIKGQANFPVDFQYWSPVSKRMNFFLVTKESLVAGTEYKF